MKLDLTIQEANILLNLIDAAVRSLGLKSAAEAVIILKKIEDAAKEPKND